MSVSFIVLWFIVGFVDAIAIALLGVLLWKAHGFFVSSRWWNSQSKFERQMETALAALLLLTSDHVPQVLG